MLRETHGPATNHGLAALDHRGHFANLRLGDAAAADNIFPRLSRKIIAVRVKALGVALDKFPVNARRGLL